MRVPDTHLLGSGAPAAGDYEDIAIIAHNEERLSGRSRLQALPIELDPLSLEPELDGKLDET
jgi:hypothetical protein